VFFIASEKYQLVQHPLVFHVLSDICFYIFRVHKSHSSTFQLSSLLKDCNIFKPGEHKADLEICCFKLL